MNLGLTISAESEAQGRSAFGALVEGLSTIDAQLSVRGDADEQPRGVVTDLLITGLAPAAVIQVARLIREIVRRDRVEIEASSEDGRELRISARPDDLPSTEDIVRLIVRDEPAEPGDPVEE